MKKALKLFLATAVLVLCSLALFACGKNNHTHDWDTSAISWEWDGYSSATATITCKGDATHKEELIATVTDSATAATCTANGATYHTAKVTFNNAEYSDVKTETITATGHNYDTATATWTWNGTSSATATLKCKNNSAHTLPVTATVKDEVTTAATCETAGVKTFTATAKYNGATLTDSKTAAITATGHNYDTTNIAWTWDGTTSATAVLTCKNNAAHKSSAISATVAPVTLTAATCTKAGVGGYEAGVTIDGNKYTNQSATTTVISATGHSLSTTVKAATCVERGVETTTCSKCDYSTKNVLNVIDHTWKNGVSEATCVSSAECTVCGTTYAALGHNYVSSNTSSRARDGEEDTVNCLEGKVITYTCSRCDDEYEDVIIAPKDHKVEVWTKDESEDGLVQLDGCNYIQYYTGTCTVCGDENAIKEVDVEQHNFEIKIKTLSTCTTKGTKTYTCKDCGCSYDAEYDTVNDAHDWTTTDDINYVCSYNSKHTKTVIAATDKTSTTVSNLSSTSEVALKDATISLDEDTLSGLGSGSISIGAESKSVGNISGLTNEQIEQIGDNPIYDLSLSVGGDAQSSFDGSVTVKVPYTLEENEDPDNICIWYINDEGVVTPMAATYIEENGTGYAVFKTNHFSYYTVTRLSAADRCKVYGHSYNVTEVNKEGTTNYDCSSESYTLKVCRRCGDTVRENIVSARGHDYSEYKVTTSATCTTSGVKTRTCETCGNVSAVKIAAIGHSWQADESNSIVATCQKAGKNAFVCANDDTHTYKTIIAQKAHKYEKTVTNATCEQDGYTLNVCIYNCGDSYKSEIKSALGHNYKVTNQVAHTQTAEGYIQYVCANDSTHTKKVTDTDIAHVWNISEATCGEDKVCTICGLVGATKTGNHTMVSGTCSVCGYGCTKHTFTTTTSVEPECESDGYIKETCSNCGYVKTTTIVATGHSGTFICADCGTTLVKEDLFTNAYKSLIDEPFTLVINNFSVTMSSGILNGNDEVVELISEDTSTSASQESTDVSYTYNFLELAVTFDSNGKLYATGYGEMSGDYGDLPFDSDETFEAVIKDGYVYIDVTDNASATYIMSTNKITATDKAQRSIMVYSFDSMAASNPIVGYIPTVLEWLNSDIKPIISAATELNKADINNKALRLAETFLNIEEDNGGYVLTLDWEKIADFNEVLYHSDLSVVYDTIYGDGAYKQMTADIVDKLSMPMGELLTTLADKGYDADEFITAANNLVAIIFGSDEITLQAMLDESGITDMLKEILDAEDDEDVSLAALLSKDSAKNSRTLLDYINIVMSVMDVTQEELTKSNVEAALIKAGGHNVYALLTSFVSQYLTSYIPEVDASTIYTMVDGIIDYASNYVNLTVTLYSDGSIQNISLGFDELPISVLSQSITVDGNISLVANYDSNIDYTSFVKEVAKLSSAVTFDKNFADMLYGDTYVDAATLTSGETSDKVVVEFYESGKIKSIATPFTEEYTGYSYSYGKVTCRYFNVVNGVRTYYFDEDAIVYIYTDCGSWYRLSVTCNGQKEEYTSCQIEKIYRNGELIRTTEGEPYESSYTNPGNQTLYYYYNSSTKKILSAGNSYDESMSENGKHEYYEDVSMEVKPTGCEDWGKKYYTCVKCGDTYTKYYTLGHRNIAESATLVKADGTCTDGVVVTKTCGVCNKVILNKTYYYHYDVEERVDISAHVPDTCTEQPKYVYVSHCACGEYGRGGIEYDNTSEGYSGNYTFVCRDKCGLVIQITCNKAHDKDVHCKVNYTYVFNVYKDNTCVEAITLTTYGREHREIMYGTLNGATCADGATIIWKCVICGRVTNTRESDGDEDYHYNFVAEEYDLSKIGKDGEKLYVLADPCGNEDFTGTWSFAYNVLIYDKEGNELELTYDTEVEGANGNLIYEGLYKCPTTDPEACGLVVGLMVERDSNNCSATLKVLLNCDDDWNGGTVIIENIALGKWHVLEDNGRYLTESDITDSSYVYTVCSYRYIEECVNKDYEEYEDDYKHNISENIIDAATCTQYGFKHEVCDRCGEDLGYGVILPRGHSWRQLADNSYVCSVCGLQSSTGSDGYVVLEDATNKFAGKDGVNSDDYVVGYWMRECAYYAGYYGSYDYDAFDYTEYYTAKISLIYTNSEGNDDCLVDTEGEITVTDLKQYGNYVKFSTTEVAEWAAKNGITAENGITEYTIRISFVPVTDNTNYDYAITFTA